MSRNTSLRFSESDSKERLGKLNITHTVHIFVHMNKILNIAVVRCIFRMCFIFFIAHDVHDAHATQDAHGIHNGQDVHDLHDVSTLHDVHDKHNIHHGEILHDMHHITLSLDLQSLFRHLDYSLNTITTAVKFPVYW